ncbi:flagellar motor protein MotB [Lewinellaceae bacterium SD302]|nr:flagellar motor protein MotB [Lewinellaceae bacterium SD302]
MKSFPSILFYSLIFLFGSCAYTTKVTDGATAIDRKQYSVAIPLLKSEFRKAKRRSEKGKVAEDLALAYVRTGKDEEAIEWYTQAYNNGRGVEALKGKAAAQKRLELYDEAIETYTELGNEIGSKYEFRKDILGAELAQGWLAEEFKAFEVEPVEFNSAQSDYAPTGYSNGQLVITSDRRETTGDATYAWTGGNFADLFLVDPRSGAVDPFDSRVNSVAHEGVASFSKDYQQMVFTRCDGGKREDAFCGLYFSERQGDVWSIPEHLPFVTEGENYLHPALSANGQTLYYSARTEDGWGGYDLFVVQKDNIGVWGEPKMLGRSINTSQNEQFPFLDGDTLYFASDGHLGMGGLDIFEVHPLANGSWSSPRNLKPPLNSGADDFGYYLERQQLADGVMATGYFSSSRPGGKGSDDIYRFQQRPLPPPPPVDETKPIVYRNVLDVYVVTDILEDPTNPASKVLGRRPIENASLTIWTGKDEKNVNTNEEGKLSLVLRNDKTYRFRASEEGYLNQEAIFSSRGLTQDPANPEQRYELEIPLDKIFENREIVLENIYYDLDESFIREDAKPSLNELVEIMKLNPDINIELGSHTDCQGTDAYNQRLSQERAASAVQYLIDEGIDAGRLVAKGYGEEVPAVDCVCNRCTDEEYQRNRRTTFRILK